MQMQYFSLINNYIFAFSKDKSAERKNKHWNV